MTASFNYNVAWIDRTFHSRAVAEALLAPERESGNISPNDYELATRFLPGVHRHYSVHSHLPPCPFLLIQALGLWRRCCNPGYIRISKAKLVEC